MAHNSFAYRMNYQQTLQYIFQKLPMYSRIGADAFKKDLTNIRLLCEHFGNPQLQFKSIHIGGTNGKGSVSHMLAGILQASGYKTGLYTSPHLYDFRERIKINGDTVPEDFVIQFVEKTKPLIEDLEPSFFEITVVMAFQYFKEQKVDIAVIEVGLGGRLDSTNIIVPELSVITNISYDHTNMLGNTLPLIAAEKGGIIKQNIPVVIGEKGTETDAVFKQIAAQHNAPVFFAEDNFQVINYQTTVTKLDLTLYNKQEKGTEIYHPDLPGIYQTKNIITTLQAVAVLKSMAWLIDDEVAKIALSKIKTLTGLQGRWDVVREHPFVVLDVAHNEEGIKQMLLHLSQLKFNTLHLIIGMVKDKDLKNVLRWLPPSATYYFTQAHIPRALPAYSLQEEAQKFKLTGAVFDDVNSALYNALMNASPDDMIVVCGSIFLVTEVAKTTIQ